MTQTQMATDQYDDNDIPDPNDLGIDDPFAGMDEAYESAPIPENMSNDLPDGKYQCFVFSATQVKIENAESKRFGYIGIKLCFRVLNGEHRGENQYHTRFFHPTDEKSMGWLKKDLASLGVDTAMREKGLTIRMLLKEHLHLFLDRCVEIQVKRTPNQNKPDSPYVNVYINRLLDGMAIPEELRQASPAGGNGTAGGAAKAGDLSGGVAW